MAVGIVERQIAKAERRADVDLLALSQAVRDKTPADLASPGAKDDRHDFLTASLGDPAQADRMFERILDGNELQPVSYLGRGAIAARAVARIAIRSAVGGGWGTGFLIAPQVLLTNNHVLPDADTARRSVAEFAYEIDLADAPTGPLGFALEPDRLFETSEPLDFTAVAVRPLSLDGQTRVESFGHLPLLGTVGKAFEGEWLTIVQHPNGERKQICVRENRLLRRGPDVLWYSTDTLAGSSGSAVFNNDWFVVALHHSGVPERRDGRIQTVDGRDYRPGEPETRIKWVANEGIRASRIAETLRQRHPTHPLLLPMFRATAETARIRGPSAPPDESFPPRPPKAESAAMTAPFPIDIVVRVEADGTARVMGPAAREAAAPSTALAGRVAPEDGRTAPEAERAARFDAPFDNDYAGRTGFDPGFLDGGWSVPLPTLSPALRAAAAPLIPPEGTPENAPKEVVLAYRNFSVVMHAERRFAIFSAANVDYEGRYDLARPSDTWRTDPRIAAKHQVENWYYAGNRFDRGHLTRREDLEFGPTRLDALRSAADTCHWTNCVPQHEGFNQSKALWQGIERYILESNIFVMDRKLRAQIITGPVLDEGDPTHKGIRYPLQFWKVVAALDDTGDLFATAYLASQREVVAQRGIEAAPFGAFGTFQVPVAEIERLTTLSFTAVGPEGEISLSAKDPLAKRPPRRGTAALRAAESTFGALPNGYRPLDTVDDIAL